VDLERELSGEVTIPADLALFTGPVAQEDIKPKTPKGKIGVYHSHAQESYIPTEKKENVAPKGGIVKVGESFSKGLQKSGVDVIHSEVPHGKSDSGAYRRSRRTALRIMQKGIDALIDIHRDAVPPEPYREEVKGKEIAKVLLVIGGQNQHRDANTRFAGGLKRVADKTYPGLVRGVYWGRGNYNQDLSPRALLMEMGSTTNERIRAERGAELMGEVTADFLYEGKPGAGPGLVGGDRTPDEPRSAARTIAALLGLLAAGVIGFLVISTGGVKEAVAKLKQFRRTEFANFLGRARERVRTGRRKNKRD
ncbi:MAG: stage II sporulation protein P, partial [Firmicutes bacterium]|nr:stage II sporulation protein P [Bacillota bacterium]